MKKLFTLSLIIMTGLFVNQAFAEVNAAATLSVSANTGAVPLAKKAVYSSVLRPGVQNTDVVSLQTRLKNLGYYTTTVDGKYGPATAKAVRAYQRAKSLKIDGIVGARTSASLKKAVSVKAVPQDSNSKSINSNDTASNVACPMIYQPVCGQAHTIECIKAPCPQPEPTTYGNKCMLTAAKASFLYEGECKSSRSTNTNTTAVDRVSPRNARVAPTLSASSTATLHQGISSTAVATLQSSLKNLGYYAATIDGKYGPATAKAVRAYQRAKSLKIDGIVGVKTLSRIATDTAASLSLEAEVSETNAVPTR